MYTEQSQQMQTKPSVRRPVLWGALFVLLLGAAAWSGLAGEKKVQAQTAGGITDLHGFELLNAGQGWLWQGDDLNWTQDGGVTWQRITPAAGAGYSLADVHFAGPAAGWALLLSKPQPGSVPQALLAASTDGGVTWQQSALPPALAAAVAQAKAVHLLPLRAGAGWLAAETAGGSNFSRGALWYTEDGGATWEARTLPLAEPVQFVDKRQGWLAGGQRGDALWRTQDGGLSWAAQPLPRAQAPGERLQVYPPLFAADGMQALLPILVRSSDHQTLEWYTSNGESDQWRPAQRISLPLTGGYPNVAAVDPRAWLLAQTGSILPPVAPLPFFANFALHPSSAAQAGAALVQVKMGSTQTGWALAAAAGQNAQLLATADGGRTWQPMPLPAATSAAEASAPPPAAGPAAAQDTVSRTAVARGAGFDVCDLPYISELAAWYSASPYRIINLYLGGSVRYCDNEQLTAQAVSQLSAQGWSFIPTWVGPQAPCSGYKIRFSANPTDAYSQGRAEAEAALAAATALGLSEADGSGTILYYDMESFDPVDESCIAAAQAFVSGWSSRLHERGSQSGLYGSACSPRIADYAALPSAPDAVWVAQWNRDAYDPAMNVWGIACLDDSLWTRSQRIRQYTGGHDESWGGVTLEIDSNVADGLVADPGRTQAPPTPTPPPTPQPVVLLETAELTPRYADGMCGAGWHLLPNERGYPAFLATNRNRNGTIPPQATPLAAQWRADVPVDGSYRVEAYIPAHEPIRWLCPEGLLPSDTATAHYAVQHAQGTVHQVMDQAAAQGGWLLLGAFPFRAAQPAQVTLETLTEEAAHSRTVAASALRLTRVGDAGSQFLYLPQIRRQ